jgi:drug/metabolite transporter (DMT)-like permease
VVILLFAIICLIWGSTWMAIKVGLDGVPPFLGAALRFIISAVIVGGVLAARGRRVTLTRDDRICIVSLGVLVFWLNYAAVYWAEIRISSGLTAVLFSTMPLMTALLSRFWTHSETLSAQKVAGILIGVAGTGLLFWPEDRLGNEQVLAMSVTLAGCFCSTISLVLMKRHGRHSDPFVLNFFGMSIGAVLLIATSLMFERWSEVVWTVPNITALIYLAVVGSVIAFTLYYRLVKMMDATVVSLSTLIIPIVALVLGRLFLDEVITVTAVAGVVTILAGVGVTVLGNRLRPAGRRITRQINDMQ